MIRRFLYCDCGNRDDEDVGSTDVALPPCSDGCGRTMKTVGYVTFIRDDAAMTSEYAAYLRGERADPRD